MTRIYSIEFLRLLTSLSVLLYHYRLFFAPYNSYSLFNFSEKKFDLPFYTFLEVFYTKGIYGVHVFYTISGFVFALVYLSSKEKISLKEFFVNRFGRLYPLHFATLIIVTFLLFANWFLNNSFVINPFHFNDIYHFFLQIFFISSWGFENGHSFNTPIWSVSVEVAIYGIFFLTLNYLKKYKIWLALFLCLVLLIINKIGLNNSLFLECARLFFSGVLIYYIFAKSKFKQVLLFLSLLLIVLSFVGNFKTYIFCPSLVLFTVMLEEKIKNIKIKNFFSVSGNLTYALYLLHFPVILLAIITQKKLNFSGTIFEKHYFFFSFLIVLIILSYNCFKFYEKPMNKKIRNVLLRKN